MCTHWRHILQTFDASSMIYAWDNYPIGHFPPLWEWMAGQIGRKMFSMPAVAYEEVKRREPDCYEWLRGNEIRCFDVTNEVIQESLVIKKLLGIKDDKYHSKGVGENDLLIIATAKVEGLVLVSNEAVQTKFPECYSKAKIPAVCKMDEVHVDCWDFIKLIKQSNSVFSQ